MEYFIDGFVQNKAHWRGLGKSHIYYVKPLKSWKLESFYDPETKYAVFAADDSSPSGFYPLGRSEWKINAGICQKEGGVPHRMTQFFSSLRSGQSVTRLHLLLMATQVPSLQVKSLPPTQLV